MRLVSPDMSPIVVVAPNRSRRTMLTGCLDAWGAVWPGRYCSTYHRVCNEWVHNSPYISLTARVPSRKISRNISHFCCDGLGPYSSGYGPTLNHGYFTVLTDNLSNTDEQFERYLPGPKERRCFRQ